jgi:hypothetical protein
VDDRSSETIKKTDTLTVHALDPSTGRYADYQVTTNDQSTTQFEQVLDGTIADCDGPSSSSDTVTGEDKVTEAGSEKSQAS